jgi:hypothetical protein
MQKKFTYRALRHCVTPKVSATPNQHSRISRLHPPVLSLIGQMRILFLHHIPGITYLAPWAAQLRLSALSVLHTT